MNGPTVLFNGAAIYDFAQQRYLYTAFLPESVRGHICRLLEDLPETALEIYHDDDSIHAINPNEITYHHGGAGQHGGGAVPHLQAAV